MFPFASTVPNEAAKFVLYVVFAAIFVVFVLCWVFIVLIFVEFVSMSVVIDAKS